MTELDLFAYMFADVRQRTLATLAAVSALPNPQAVLAWRPAPGRAHIGWQLMHIAVTEDRYLNVRIRNAAPARPDLCDQFAGGSTPADTAPTAEDILTTLAANREALLGYLRTLDPTQLDTKPYPEAPRTYREGLALLIWHESHHQGQAHITLNLYRAAHA